MKNNFLILLCGGSGTRMRGAVADKILMPLAGTPVVAHSAKAFIDSGLAGTIICVCRDASQEREIARIFEKLPVTAGVPVHFCRGGHERRDSVLNGLRCAAKLCGNAEKISHEEHEVHEEIFDARANARASEVEENLEKKSSNDCALAQSFEKSSCPSCSSCDIFVPALAFIHDAARPLVRAENFRSLATAATQTGAAVLAHKCVNTIKRTRVPANSGDACELEDLNRSLLWEMETPQVFDLAKILRAYERISEISEISENSEHSEKNPVPANCVPAITDDVSAWSLAFPRVPVMLVENPFPNPKLTVPADLRLISLFA